MKGICQDFRRWRERITKNLKNERERGFKKSESVKKSCVTIKGLCLHKSLFLVRCWIVCSLFYLNKENDIVELEGIQSSKKRKLSHWKWQFIEIRQRCVITWVSKKFPLVLKLLMTSTQSTWHGKPEQSWKSGPVRKNDPVQMPVNAK
jgi:hypothetical protein